jgi:hypothetical protein
MPGNPHIPLPCGGWGFLDAQFVRICLPFNVLPAKHGTTSTTSLLPQLYFTYQTRERYMLPNTPGRWKMEIALILPYLQAVCRCEIKVSTTLTIHVLDGIFSALETKNTLLNFVYNHELLIQKNTYNYQNKMP